jgi:hypothetical protein
MKHLPVLLLLALTSRAAEGAQDVDMVVWLNEHDPGVAVDSAQPDLSVRFTGGSQHLTVSCREALGGAALWSVANASGGAAVWRAHRLQPGAAYELVLGERVVPFRTAPAPSLWGTASWIGGFSRLRASFTLSQAPQAALLSASALGCFMATVNGQPVGPDLLAPGFSTAPPARLLFTS